ncbi:MAG: nucleoside-diphosphate kinase [Patescibacteria group bacterium]|nr:nucleoside-diphosphate kinase [Patescibacteria group bacterium]
MSYGIGILKPDCLKRKLETEVYDMIIASGLKIVFKKRVQLSFEKVEELYRDWVSKDFYPGLLEYMLSAEVEIFIVEGDNAISELQSIVGGRDSLLSPDLTIRGKFATSLRENIIHSTSNQETFVRETELLLEVEANQWIY